MVGSNHFGFNYFRRSVDFSPRIGCCAVYLYSFLKMYILGISCFYHDSAATLLFDGEIIAAVQEERFTRKKHDDCFPINSINYCLKEAKINLIEVSYIVFYEKPFLKFERILETYLAFAPKGFKTFAKSLPVWIKDKLFQKNKIIQYFNKNFGKTVNWEEKLLFSDHHLSHASSAFFPSPFNNAAILTLDGVGEWTSTSLYIGEENKLIPKKEINFPHSLGLLYSAFTYFLGFKVNSGEYKVMGLAPYGDPKYANLIKENLIKINDDGSFQMNLSYFDYCTGLKMTNKKFHDLFKSQPRKSESAITQKEMDIAASIQNVIEEIIVKIGRNIFQTTGEKNLCLAGGVALNCVANGVLLKEKIFNKIWIQPASGDAGGSLGAALSIWHIMLNKKRNKNLIIDHMKGSYLGPSYSNTEIEQFLSNSGAVYKKLNEKELIDTVAKILSEKKAVGWMQGRMEFGPRSLGNRSILADPRAPFMQKQLNLKVKFRESFRPFAPSILRDKLSEWYELDIDSPYMLFVSRINKNLIIETNNSDTSLFGIEKLNKIRSKVPAVTHIDYTSRIQTVHKDTNIKFHLLISKFSNYTNCPLLVNTSFNIRGEPIVCDPSDALKCFLGTDLDALAIGNFLLFKNNQDPKLKRNYTYDYELD